MPEILAGRGGGPGLTQSRGAPSYSTAAQRMRAEKAVGLSGSMAQALLCGKCGRVPEPGAKVHACPEWHLVCGACVERAQQVWCEEWRAWHLVTCSNCQETLPREWHQATGAVQCPATGCQLAIW